MRLRSKQRQSLRWLRFSRSFGTNFELSKTPKTIHKWRKLMKLMQKRASGWKWQREAFFYNERPAQGNQAKSDRTLFINTMTEVSTSK